MLRGGWDTMLMLLLAPGLGSQRLGGSACRVNEITLEKVLYTLQKWVRMLQKWQS